jgi:hypothetical protein
VSRPALEVADIFRGHGAAWRRANAGHVGLDQLKVMSAIERCRTVALGGHVARCEDCAHTAIAYNSCRNRHCPKCQGAAAKQWLAEREAELLPVGYFHLVFTLPAPIANIAYQNKAVIYDLLFKAAAEATLAIAADPKHLGARIGITAVLHTWGSAMTHHPHVHMIVPGGGLSHDGERWIACRPTFFLPVRVLSRLFRRLFLQMLAAAHKANRLAFFGDRAALAETLAFTAFLASLRKAEWVVYAKQPFGGPQAVLAYLSRYTHRVAISNRRLISADETGVTFRWKDYRTEDAVNSRVHPALPDACATQGRASHPSLWTVRQWQPRGQHRAGARAARCAAPGAAARDRLHRRIRATARAAETMPVLRRPHDHHRDLRAWLPAKASPHTCSADHPDRHLMRPSPPIDNRSAPCLSRRLTAGSARARVGPPQSSALSRRILSCSVRPTRLLLHAPSLSRQKRSRRTLRSNLLKPRPAAKSP